MDVALWVQGYDLLAGLKKAVEAGAVQEVTDRKQQARLVKQLEMSVPGVSRAEAERALSENVWALAAAQAALAGGGEPEPEEEGAELTRGPSTNTLRNRRLERLESPTNSPAAQQLDALALALDSSDSEFTTADSLEGTAADAEPEPEPAEAEGAELTRGPSNNTLRNLRLERLGLPPAGEPQEPNDK